jgi:DNA mismatch endonuclease (patch repair protein)
MADVFSKRKRSEVMSRIRGRGNRDTELALARLLRANHITGWRRHSLVRVASGKWQVTRKARASVLSPVTRHLSLTVRPDFVFLKSRTAIFVDGCFWHGCPKHCKYAKWLTRSVMAGNPPSPKSGLRRTGRAFWRRKLAGNKTRDRLVDRTLRHSDWRVLRIWEHELQKTKKHSTPHLASGHPLPGRGGEGESSKVVQRIQRALA